MATSRGSAGLGRLLLGLAVLGTALLLTAWMAGTQPFQAPDEASHYLRALNLSRGHLLGPKVAYEHPNSTARQLAYVDRDTRAVFVPGGLSPPDVQCRDGHHDVDGCDEATEVGNYPPLSYLLPAAALKVSHTARTALWLARIGSALQCGAFLALAFLLLWDGRLSSLVGLFAAISPMVLFVCSVLNPNGLEIAAGLAFAAGVLRVSRRPEDVAPWVWISVALSGVVTILAWQLGPVFVVGDLLLLAGLLGVNGIRSLVRGGAGPRWTGGLLVLAGVAWAVYGQTSGLTHTGFGIRPIRATLQQGVTQLDYVLRDSVGNFGSLRVHLPLGIDWLWWLLVAGLVAAALWRCGARERLVLAATVVLALAFPVLFYAWVYRFSGYGLQGRYMLPVLVLIPMLAGELLHRHRGVRSDRVAVPAVVAVIAVVQGYAWWYDARATADARGTIRFYAHAVWSPPLGWGPWIVVAALGAICLLGAAAEGLRAQRDDVRPPTCQSVTAP
jgi:hypothetical protein